MSLAWGRTISDDNKIIYSIILHPTISYNILPIPIYYLHLYLSYSIILFIFIFILFIFMSMLMLCLSMLMFILVVWLLMNGFIIILSYINLIHSIILAMPFHTYSIYSHFLRYYLSTHTIILYYIMSIYYIMYIILSIILYIRLWIYILIQQKHPHVLA